MSYHPCISGCGHFLAPQDSHDRCIMCRGIQHTEEAFVDGACSSCGDMTISELHKRLCYVKHCGVPLPLPRSSVRPGTRGGAASCVVRGGLRITVRASPSGVPHPSSTPLPVELDRVHHVFPSVPPLMTRCRSLHRRASPLSPGMTTRLRCPLRVW